MDDTHIAHSVSRFDRALTAEEIAALSDLPPSDLPPRPRLVHHIHHEELPGGWQHYWETWEPAPSTYAEQVRGLPGLLRFWPLNDEGEHR